MPELPEVETVRRGLERLVVGKTIQRVEVRYPRMVHPSVEIFVERLEGQTFQNMKRRGKYLLFHLTKDVLVSHLRMEGKFLLFEGEMPENKHVHVLFHLADGSSLVYQDVRKFGTMELLAPADLTSYFAAKKLGPEPTQEDFEEAAFLQALSKSKKPIKSYLLDQTLVVGLGNIYVDEVLWRAQVHPATPSLQLSPEAGQRIRQATIQVLAQAVEKGGSTIRSYQNALGAAGSMQDYLQVYGKTGQTCQRCGHAIEKIKLAGRGTHFCPVCQVMI